MAVSENAERIRRLEDRVDRLESRIKRLDGRLGLAEDTLAEEID